MGNCKTRTVIAKPESPPLTPLKCVSYPKGILKTPSRKSSEEDPELRAYYDSFSYSKKSVSVPYGDTSFLYYGSKWNPFLGIQEQEDHNEVEEKETNDTLEHTKTHSELEDSLELSVKIDRKNVQISSKSDQTYTMVVSVKLNPCEKFIRPPVDLIVVLDVSENMKGNKIENIKFMFKSFLDFMAPHDRIAIVVYNTISKIICPLVMMSEENKEKVLVMIDQIEPHGRDNMETGLQAALKILESRRLNHRVASIFLLSSDSNENANKRILDLLDQSKAGDNFTINTFGYGPDHDASLLAQIASKFNGNYYFIDQLSKTDDVFISCLGGLTSTWTQNILLKLHILTPKKLQPLQIAKTYGDSSAWSLQDGIWIAKLGPFSIGRERKFVFDVKFPRSKAILWKGEFKIPLVKAEIQTRDHEGIYVRKVARLEIIAVNEEDEYIPDEDDEEVLKDKLRVFLAESLVSAIKLSDEGFLEKAKKLMIDLAQGLEIIELSEDPFVQNLKKDVEMCIGWMNNENDYVKRGKILLIECVKSHYYMTPSLGTNVNYCTKMESDIRHSLFKKKYSFIS